MFGLGMPEILLILAIALIVIGPKKLPDLAKTLGRAMGEFKRSAQDLKRSIDIESTVKDLDDINVPETDLKDVLKDANFKEETASPADEEGTGPADEEETDPADEERTDPAEPDTNIKDSWSRDPLGTDDDDVSKDTESENKDNPPLKE